MNCVKTASILRNFFFSLNRSLLLDSVAHSVCKLKGEKKKRWRFYQNDVASMGSPLASAACACDVLNVCKLAGHLHRS